MSISNGNKKRNNKKNGAITTATVYPVIQPIQKEESEDVVEACAPVPSKNGVKKNRVPSVNITYGQKIEAASVPEATIASSVADIVHEVIPQSQVPLNAQNEQIYWVNFQKCDYWKGQFPQIGYVLIIGLARGYQIWWLDDNGNCLEVLSERKGPLKVGCLLPVLIDGEDNFRESRPLFARVDGNPLLPESKLSAVSILSLKTGKDVHELTFPESVVDLRSSSNAFIVALSESLVICHPGTFEECLTVSVAPSPDASFAPNFTLSGCLLAFADKTLNKQVQSVGGVVSTEDSSYSGQIMNAAKSLGKTVSSIGESLVTFTTSGSQNKQTISNADIGIVTVIDLNAVMKREQKVIEAGKHIIAHFVAHEEPIGFLAFGHGGQLLLTCPQSATTFHLFAVHPHPGIASLGSFQHLYTLYRGNSSAKVIDCAFSDDNRWVAITTNHGTTHLFAITPYGGPISLRTHGGKLVNKESRFERTAGLTSENVTRNINPHGSSKPNANSSGVSQFCKEHPAIGFSSQYKTVVNPRLNLHTAPISLQAVAKLRARVFSAEGLSAWASDNTPVSISSSLKNQRLNSQGCIESSRKISAAFTRPFGENAHPDGATLCVLNADGVLTSYLVQVRQERHNSTSSTSSNNLADPLSSSPSPSGSNPSVKSVINENLIKVKTAAVSQWFLHRSRNSSSLEPPLMPKNILLNLGVADDGQAKNGSTPDHWLQHVEVETYTGPHRRLWTGPQFNFGIYAATGHSSAQLFSPNDTHPTFITAQKCCPVLIEKNSAYPIMGNDFSNNSQIVCGSWSSDFDMKGLMDPAVKEKIEDAMRDLDFESTSVRPERQPARIRNVSSNSSNNTIDLLSLSGMDL